MPALSSLGSMPRRALNIIYMLDTSGSMSGLPIQILNQAMYETIDALRDVAKHNGDARLKISVMQYSSNVKWMHPEGPQEVDDFIWTDLTAGGQTSTGAAMKELYNHLSDPSFLDSLTGSLLPVIIFMTDGYPTDDYIGYLEKLKTMKLFNRATKIGFALGDNPDEEMIARFTGTHEAVIRTTDLAEFSRQLRFVSVTSSVLASESRAGSGEGTEAVIPSIPDPDDDPWDDVDKSVIQKKDGSDDDEWKF